MQTTAGLQGLPSRVLLDEMAAAKDVDTALTAALKVLPTLTIKVMQREHSKFDGLWQKQ